MAKCLALIEAREETLLRFVRSHQAYSIFRNIVKINSLEALLKVLPAAK